MRKINELKTRIFTQSAVPSALLKKALGIEEELVFYRGLTEMEPLGKSK